MAKVTAGNEDWMSPIRCFFSVYDEVFPGRITDEKAHNQDWIVPSMSLLTPALNPFKPLKLLEGAPNLLFGSLPPCEQPNLAS